LARPGVRGTFSQPGPSRPAVAVRLARTLGIAMNRKRNRQVRKRHTAIYATTAKEVTKLSVTYDSATDSISIADADPASYRTEIFYERDSGKDKVLLSATATETLPAFDPWEQILGQCSYLFAIDTNTRILSGRRISYSLACALPTRLQELPQKIQLRGLCAYALFETAPEVNPETVAWHIFLRRHILPANLPPQAVVGIVVDSELGRLPKINARTEPYYDKFFLPPSVMLIYASSDAATQTIPSEMIRYCDTMASQLFDDLAPQLDRLPSPTNGDSNFKGFT
jgi:hypothetical protein